MKPLNNTVRVWLLILFNNDGDIVWVFKGLTQAQAWEEHLAFDKKGLTTEPIHSASLKKFLEAREDAIADVAAEIYEYEVA